MIIINKYFGTGGGLYIDKLRVILASVMLLTSLHHWTLHRQ